MAQSAVNYAARFRAGANTFGASGHFSEFAIYSLLQELEKTHPSLTITPLIGSVQDQPFVARVLGKFAIDTIYHAAAYKHVPLNGTECDAMCC